MLTHALFSLIFSMICLVAMLATLGPNLQVVNEVYTNVWLGGFIFNVLHLIVATVGLIHEG